MSELSARQIQFRLERLSPDIRASYEQARIHAVETVKYALVCGRKLNEAKELVRHGEFGRFMVETLEIHPSTANRYMKLATEWPRIEQEIGADKAALLTFTEGLAKATKHPQKGGNSSAVRDFPPSEGNTEEEPDESIEPELVSVNEPEAGPGEAGVFDSPDELFGAADTGAAGDHQPSLPGAGGPGIEAIDDAIRPVQELVEELHQRHPSEKLRLEIERGLDIVFGALMSWSKL